MFKKFNLWVEERRGKVTRVEVFKPITEQTISEAVDPKGRERGRARTRERPPRKERQGQPTVAGEDCHAQNERPPSRWRRRSRAPSRSGRRHEDPSGGKPSGVEQPTSPTQQQRLEALVRSASPDHSPERSQSPEATEPGDNHGNDEGNDDTERSCSEGDSARPRRPLITIDDLDMSRACEKWAKRVFKPPPEPPAPKEEDKKTSNDGGVKTSDKKAGKKNKKKKSEELEDDSSLFPKKHGAFCRASTRLGFRKKRNQDGKAPNDPATLECLKTEPDDESTPITEEEYQRSLKCITTCVEDPYASPHYIATDAPLVKPVVRQRYLNFNVSGSRKAPAYVAPAPVPQPPVGRPVSRCHRMMRALKQQRRRPEREGLGRSSYRLNNEIELHDLEGRAGGCPSTVLILNKF